MPPSLAAAEATGLLTRLARIHGWYYVLTGFWPVIDLRSFQWITGRKHDLWLVQTAGLLIGVIGSVLLLGARRRPTTPELPVLAVGSAISLAGIDIVYVRRRRILPIYLGDALVELVLAGGWIYAWLRRLRT